MDKENKRILFISNGNGEDSISAAIIKEIPKGFLLDAFPVIGFGSAYGGVCNIVGPVMHIPSEGHRKAGSIAKDIKGGMLSGTWRSIKFLRSIKGKYHKIIAIGDSVVPILCTLAGIKIDIYLDVYKNGYAHTYLKIERWAIKKACKKTYCRDDILAASLRKYKINAISKGNIMIDIIPFGDYDVSLHRSKKTAITLLPGSRKTTARNLKLQVEAIKKLPKALYPDIFVAVARDISVEELAKVTSMKYHEAISKQASDLGYLSDGELKLNLTSGVAGNIIKASDVLLSQAATLTLQALGIGKPAISFIEDNDRPKRTSDRKKLAGDSRVFVSQDADELAHAMKNLLGDKKQRDRMGEIGKSRIGSSGTLAAVISDIIS
ncbi:MAG: hypothetical protein L3J15_04665 [Devosiaceae bacterium]|nr:hypothetical protein [Devosiaceae bacterium]